MADNAFVPIATYTTTGSTASYTFSSIPSTYTDLVLTIDSGMSGVGYAYMYFNGDTTSSNYSRTELFGSGTTPSGSRFSNLIPITLDTAVGSTTNRIEIFNYSNASKYKSVLYKFGSAGLALLGGGNWRGTSAISSITLTGYSTTVFSANSVFTLYGIKAA